MRRSFQDCYRIEITTEDDSIAALITNNETGLFYHEKYLARIKIDEKSRFRSQDITAEILINNKLFCNWKHLIPSGFSTHKTESVIHFSNGTTISCFDNNMYYFFSPKTIDYVENGKIICQLKLQRLGGFWKKLLGSVDYSGKIHFDEKLEICHIFVILQLLLIDHIRTSDIS